MNTRLDFDHCRPFPVATRLRRGMVVAAIVAALGIAGLGTVAAGGGTIDPSGNNAVAASMTLSNLDPAVYGSGPVDPTGNLRDVPGFRSSADETEAPADAMYLEDLDASFEILTGSLEQFAELLNDPDFGDDQSLDQLADILSVWVAANEGAKAMTPPEDFEAIHNAYVSFTTQLADAAVDIANGDLWSAISHLQEAQEQAIELADLLDWMTDEEDTLDRRSGVGPLPVAA